MLSFIYKNYNNLTRNDSTSCVNPSMPSNYYNADKTPLTVKSNILYKNKFQLNPDLRDCYSKLTNEYIRKVTESYNKDKCYAINTKFNNFNIIKKEDSSRDNNLLGYIICILSSTTFVYYFYKSSWLNMFSFNRYIDVSTK
jgi:hypothetical protein